MVDDLELKLEALLAEYHATLGPSTIVPLTADGITLVAKMAARLAEGLNAALVMCDLLRKEISNGDDRTGTPAPGEPASATGDEDAGPGELGGREVVRSTPLDRADSATCAATDN